MLSNRSPVASVCGAALVRERCVQGQILAPTALKTLNPGRKWGIIPLTQVSSIDMRSVRDRLASQKDRASVMQTEALLIRTALASPPVGAQPQLGRIVRARSR